MAADQIALRIPETSVIEGSAFTATANFRTRATAAATVPTSIKYRVDCLSTGKELTDWTTVAAASSASIAITATHNAIQNQGNEHEVKQLTVVSDFELATQYVEAISWRIENLYGSP